IDVSGINGGVAQVVSVASGASLSLGDIRGTACSQTGVGAGVSVFGLGAVQISSVDLANTNSNGVDSAAGGDLFVSSAQSISTGALSVLGLRSASGSM